MACVTCGGTTSTPTINYTLPDCPSGEQCEDIQLSNCIAYKGPNLSLLGINNNARLKDVLLALHKSMMSVGFNFPAIPYSEWYCYVYTVTVNNLQTKTIVEYIDQTGTLQTITASPTSNSGLTGVSDRIEFCALDGSPVLVSGSGTLFKGEMVKAIAAISANSTTLTVDSTTNVVAGQKVTLYSGTGQLASNTVVASVGASTITLSAAPTVALSDAILIFSSSATSCFAHD